MNRLQQLQLITAYREAGLIDKADELAADMIKEETGQDPRNLSSRLKKIRTDLQTGMDKLADKLGVPRPSMNLNKDQPVMPKKPDNVPGFPAMPVVGVRAKKPGIKLSLGDATMVIANLDGNHPDMAPLERGKGWVRGTREQLITILYYIEATPAFFTGDGQPPSECAAVRLTSKSWRAKLGLAPDEKLPVPASAGGEP